MHEEAWAQNKDEKTVIVATFNFLFSWSVSITVTHHRSHFWPTFTHMFVVAATGSNVALQDSGAAHGWLKQEEECEGCPSLWGVKKWIMFRAALARSKQRVWQEPRKNPRKSRLGRKHTHAHTHTLWQRTFCQSAKETTPWALDKCTTEALLTK